MGTLLQMWFDFRASFVVIARMTNPFIWAPARRPAAGSTSRRFVVSPLTRSNVSAHIDLN